MNNPKAHKEVIHDYLSGEENRWVHWPDLMMVRVNKAVIQLEDR